MTTETDAASTPQPRPLDDAAVAEIAKAYSFEGEVLRLGALMNGDPVPDAQIRVPVAMINRHGMIAGATGTGKTRTLQVFAEQLSDLGVPVFAADMKGDLSGVAVPGESSEKLLKRTAGIGQDWKASGHPCEFFSLGDGALGIPIRAEVGSFGPMLLAKVLELNTTQESALGLVFHYADTEQIPLVTLDDLRALLTYLTSDEGKPALKGIGGLSPQTAGVILRAIINLSAEGGDAFFGSPQLRIDDLLRVQDGKGVVSLLELAAVQDKPRLFSTFLMWLLTELYRTLPEVGDLDKPKLVFFFDEAHLLFSDASKSLVETVTQTVRLIRSKGVGIFFITQTPKDVPSAVLGQLGSRVQHALRAHTPEDAKALKATVGTYPTSAYDLAQVLTQLGTGEAVVTVIDEDGAPTPVAWTRISAPEGAMKPAPAEAVQQAIQSSQLRASYAAPATAAATAESVLAQRTAAAQPTTQAEPAHPETAEAPTGKGRLKVEKPAPKTTAKKTTTRRKEKSVVEEVLNSSTTRSIITTAVREVIKGLLKKK